MLTRTRRHPLLTLRPEEEALVEAVLKRHPTDPTEANNPFLLSGNEADPFATRYHPPPSPLHPSDQAQQGAQGVQQGQPHTPRGTQGQPHTPRGTPTPHAAQVRASLQSLPSLASIRGLTPGAVGGQSALAMDWGAGAGAGMMMLPGGESAADIAAAITGRPQSSRGECVLACVCMRM